MPGELALMFLKEPSCGCKLTSEIFYVRYDTCTSRLCAPNTVTNTVYDIEVRLRRTADAQIAQLGRETARESRGATVATVRRTRSTPRRGCPRRRSWWTSPRRFPDLMVLHNRARTLVNVRSNVNMSFDCCGFNKSGNRNSPSPGVYPLILVMDLETLGLTVGNAVRSPS